MAGNERVRFCSHCRLDVHNLAGFTPREAMDLALRSGGRLCLRIERVGGVPRTRTLAEPLYQIRRRASRLAAGAFGAALTLCSAAAAQAQSAAPAQQQQQSQRAEQNADKARPAAAGTASLAGTVFDPTQAVVPGANVRLSNRETGAEFNAVTGPDGVYRFDSLPAGTYNLVVASPGFKVSETANVQVRDGAAERADATLEVGETLSGVVVVTVASEPLVRAAMEKDLEGVRRLLSEGADANVVDGNLGLTALAAAFSGGNDEMVRELLSRGARPNVRLAYRQTALMRTREGTTPEAVRELLYAGAKVNLRDEEGDSALILATRDAGPEVIELLLRAGAKVNAKNKQGRTALMNAAAAGNAEVVRLLLDAGADVGARDHEGHSALWYARDNDRDEAAALLLAYGAYEEPEKKEQ
jgi:hypothetical protein